MARLKMIRSVRLLILRHSCTHDVPHRHTTTQYQSHNSQSLNTTHCHCHTRRRRDGWLVIIILSINSHAAYWLPRALGCHCRAIATRQRRQRITAMSYALRGAA